MSRRKMTNVMWLAGDDTRDGGKVSEGGDDLEHPQNKDSYLLFIRFKLF